MALVLSLVLVLKLGGRLLFGSGPFDLIFWSVAPRIFHTEPKGVRRSHPRERPVGVINCASRGICTGIGVVLLVFVMVLSAIVPTEGEECDTDSHFSDVSMTAPV